MFRRLPMNVTIHKQVKTCSVVFLHLLLWLVLLLFLATAVGRFHQTSDFPVQ